MSGIVVTLKTNIQVDEQGNFQFDEDENIVLIDEDDVGMLVKTHVFPISQLQNDGALMSGYISRAEVYWDKRRCPSPELVDPNDLVWISFAEQGDDTDGDDDDDGYAETIDVDEEMRESLS